MLPLLCNHKPVLSFSSFFYFSFFKLCTRLHSFKPFFFSFHINVWRESVYIMVVCQSMCQNYFKFFNSDVYCLRDFVFLSPTLFVKILNYLLFNVNDVWSLRKTPELKAWQLLGFFFYFSQHTQICHKCSC